jgi:DNA-binding NarL/FixJ family response regulator
MIVDDRRFSRDGLQALLATTPEVEVIGEAVNGSEAVRLAEQFRPDVVLMDIRMPKMNGIEATRHIKSGRPETRVILLTMYADHRTEAMDAGADVFLLKGCPAEQLLSSILGDNTKQ